MGFCRVLLFAAAVAAGMVTLVWSAGVARGIPWYQEAKLHASTGNTEDKFGCSASLSGSTAIVGAFWDDDCGQNSGSAWTYELGPTGWTETAKLLGSDIDAEDAFGVAVSVDGTTVIVGASRDEDWTGAAYIFEKGPTGWAQTAKLTASDGAENDYFGHSVAVSGTTALVGAHGDDDCADGSGSMYVFEKGLSGWTETGKLTASDGAQHDNFGFSASLNGSMAIIGAHGDDSVAGAAYVFSKGTSGWTEVAKLVASDRAGWDYFGRDVSIDGSVALVGAFQDDDLGNMSGSAYLFEDNGTAWVQIAKLLASDGAEYDTFGGAVSLSDGRALIGAGSVDRATGRNFGKAYVFEKTASGWQEVSGIIASDGSAYDEFGSAVSLDGTMALIGAVHDADCGPYSGSAYIFERALSGDANGDRKIDGTDLALWQQNYDPLGLAGENNTWECADWDLDGRIDGADLALWQQNYSPIAVTSLFSADASVPEPASLLLFAAAFVATAGFVRRKR